jgi:hypothetical protein
MCNPVRRRRQIEETLRHKQPTNTLPHTHTHVCKAKAEAHRMHTHCFSAIEIPRGLASICCPPPPPPLSLCDEGECMQSVCVCALPSIYMPENATGESNVTYRAGKTWNYLWCVCLSVFEGGIWRVTSLTQISSPRINSHICLLHFRCGHHLFCGVSSGGRKWVKRKLFCSALLSDAWECAWPVRSGGYAAGVGWEHAVASLICYSHASSFAWANVH